MIILKVRYIILILALLSPMVYADYIKDIPKTELHLHLTGAYPLSYLRSIASDEDSKKEYKELVLSLQKLARGGVTYSDSFEYFAPVRKLVNTYDKVENGVVALCENLISDGVVYVEIRTGLKDLGKGPEEYLKAVLRGIERCPKAIKVKLLLSIRRDEKDTTSASTAKKTIDIAIKYREQGVVGIDVSGDSTLGQLAQIIPEIKRAQKAKLHLALHLGESPEEIDNKEKELGQAKLLEQLKPDRIGHGVFLSPQALKWVLNHPSVPIEVCPTSSVVVGMIDHHSNHPGIKYYLKHKHPVVVGTDDPLLFNSSLTQEYHKLIELDGIKMTQIKQMIQWSFDFAFLTPEEKIELRNMRP